MLLSRSRDVATRSLRKSRYSSSVNMSEYAMLPLRGELMVAL